MPSAGDCSATLLSPDPSHASMDRASTDRPSHRKNRRDRRRRDSDPEATGRRNVDRRQERHRSKPADSPPSSCPRVVLLRPNVSEANGLCHPFHPLSDSRSCVTAAPLAGSSPPSRSQSPLSQPLSQPLPDAEPVAEAIPAFRPVTRKDQSKRDVLQPASCIKLIDPQTWTGRLEWSGRKRCVSE